MATHTAYKSVDASWVGDTSGYHLPKTFTVGSTVVADSQSDALTWMNAYAAAQNAPNIATLATTNTPGVTAPAFYGLHVYAANPINSTSNLMAGLFAHKDRDGHVVEVSFDDANVIQYSPECGGAPGVDLWRVTQCTVVSEVTL